MKFEFWRSRSHQWFWHLKARNGRILCCGGEGFKQFASMVKNVRNCYPDGMRRAMVERDLRKLVSGGIGTADDFMDYQAGKK